MNLKGRAWKSRTLLHILVPLLIVRPRLVDDYETGVDSSIEALALVLEGARRIYFI